MRVKDWSVVVGVVGSLLMFSPAWGQDTYTYEGKMALLLETYLQIQQTLASDSLESVPALARTMGRLTHEIRFLMLGRMPEDAIRKLEQIKKISRGLAQDDISLVRQRFVLFSQLFIDYLTIVGAPESFGEQKLYVFHCPMSDGYWLQRDRITKNPFYGAVMLKSGQLQGELKLKVTAALNEF